MQYAHHGTVEIGYETFGSPDGAPLLLISGTAVQMLIWPDEFCQALADRGFHVARFDNRDTGLSTHLHDAPAPGWLETMLRPSAAPYRLSDMAGDGLAVMDRLGWGSAHIIGASLGGMVAQIVAIEHPERVRTLTSIMSTPSARIGTRPTIAAIRAMIRIALSPSPAPRTPPVTPSRSSTPSLAPYTPSTNSSWRTSPAALTNVARTTNPNDGRQRAAVIVFRRPPQATRTPRRSHARHPRRPGSPDAPPGRDAPPPAQSPTPSSSPIPVWATTSPAASGQRSSARSASSPTKAQHHTTPPRPSHANESERPIKSSGSVERRTSPRAIPRETLHRRHSPESSTGCPARRDRCRTGGPLLLRRGGPPRPRGGWQARPPGTLSRVGVCESGSSARWRLSTTAARRVAGRA